jgi:hypothetical protein
VTDAVVPGDRWDELVLGDDIVVEIGVGGTIPGVALTGTVTTGLADA